MSLYDLFMSPRGFALDRYLVRYIGVSPIIRLFARQAGVEARPALLLRSRGARSGLWRAAVLPWFYVGTRRVVVASAGGQPSDPAWAVNLRKQPEAEVFIDRRLQFVRAQFLEAAEYAEAWERICAAVPTYRDYQRACEGRRRIPLVALDPR